MTSEQPNPIVTEQSKPLDVSHPILDKAPHLRELMQHRLRLGAERYGTWLHSHNSRDPVIDAAQEVADLGAYTLQLSVESESSPDERAAQAIQRLSSMILQSSEQILTALLLIEDIKAASR